MGNLRSVAKALEQIAPAQRIRISQHARDIDRADRVVLPGQGAMAACMRSLWECDLVESLLKAASSRPFLGICLGPQALLEFSEENQGVRGLGVLPGRVRHFASGFDRVQSAPLKIPHMGWNRVHQRSHPLWQGIAANSWFYFVHSYYLDPADATLVTGTADYGFEFTAAIGRENVFAVQFHPEKSAAPGLQLLANFSTWSP